MTPSPVFNLSGKKVWVAGHRGMVGGALVRRLAEEGCDLVTVGRDQVDLVRQSAVEAWLASEKPDCIFLAAAKVGGIQANNTRPAEFLYENMMIEANIIHAAHQVGVKKLVFLGSTCIYPKMAPQPIPEHALLTGPLEPTNEWYAIAKIAGIKLCQAYRRQYGCDFIAAQPTNLYGPGDNYDLESSHVLPALLRKAHEAKLSGAAELVVWGSGSPRREFLHVDDLADAVVHLAKVYSDEEHVNVGSGSEITIKELAELVCATVGFQGSLRFDVSKPDGTPRKLSDVSKLHSLGWNQARPLQVGLTQTYQSAFG
ncbi:GDP-L-fucose synthase [Aquidulcibacter sp.]|uniref:GDP-L-fucose synthase n=1 Tax=Aquidulcibacter sp. TaxID=2052990 RepID=UPI0025C0E5C6|nr:GDP-L-fucose synthase [Aquidulcibacter sp.]MCA3692492.1 GDP-L-fucose synthase [Aquidulcibacter sp.]